MNAQTRTLALALAACLPLAAQAGTPDPAAATTVMINCRYAEWPTRNEVARYLRIPEVTVGQAESTALAMSAPREAAATDAAIDVREIQQYVRRQGRHECAQGATHVQVDFLPQARDRAMAMVTRMPP